MTPDEQLRATTVCSDIDCIDSFREKEEIKGKRREERSSKQSTNEIPRESVLRGIGSILCFVGGIFLLFAHYIGIFFGVMVMIGAILGLKYQKGGLLLCIFFGLISLLIARQYFSWLFFSAVSFTIVGSLPGLFVGNPKQNPIEITWKNLREKLRKNLLSIISSIICLVGGAIFTWAGITFYYNPGGLFFGTVVVVGAISGLKYQVGGRLLGVIGLLSPLLCYEVFSGLFPVSAVDCINIYPIYFYGTILIIVGTIVGLIGGILKRRLEAEQGKVKKQGRQHWLRW
jgi:hypothetical protein